ncbi:hypothetical protein IJS77_03680 [bacterium]|nr:hypothetical protein [bacterium]
MKKIIYAILAVMLFTGTIQGFDTIYTQAAPTQKTSAVYTGVPVEVNSLDVVKAPQKYLNKTIIMKASFDKFSTLGLDYKPAMRSSENYIGILIKRDDVVDHTIPLSEMKLFLKRDLAEKNINLESDDKIQITGKVFSTALGDPWIDITEIKVLQKAAKKDKK